ncbi:hypothetical protein KDH83_22560 [Achromobacter sp. Marseille-Q0513]|uniref:hypothetical protein n=1 Tax=Achromobacter sp. Marseille-Q0513 TaxID=2829161 RepID=UPI001BA3942B|nr:hypothetical protein [Achromobacter sp. Marseille-Q0513]MBR8656097.1 hypothetical protein [Achromobacter sp. Marseille-Q0513]
MKRFRGMCASLARRLPEAALALACLLDAGTAARAWPAVWPTDSSDVIEAGSYSNCRYAEDATRATISVDVKFRGAAGNVAGKTFMARGMLFYSYDAQGKLKVIADNVNGTLNGIHGNAATSGGNYRLFYATISREPWTNANEVAVKVVISAPLALLADWPAVAFYPVNVTTDQTVVLPRFGAVYIGKGTTGCQIITDHTKPPPPAEVTEIKVSAPDWDLGELERGKETTRTFANPNEQLCFNYATKYIGFEKYLISASNRNGEDLGKYLLVNADDASQTIPYSLGLTGPRETVSLPSAAPVQFTLSKDGRTCLNATFKAWASDQVKGGDFSDVLTFTITTQS